MKKTNVTFGQLDSVLRGFGFTVRPGNARPPGYIYEHKNGGIIMLPAFRKKDKIYEHHLLAARMELDHFGIADLSTFESNLQKAG